MDKLTKPLYFLATILVIIVVGSISHAAFDELKGDSYEVIKAEEIIDDTLIIQQDDQGRIYIKQNDQVLAKVIPEKNILEKNDRSYYLSEGTLWQEDQMQLTAAQEMMVMYELATPQVLEIFWGTAIDRVHYRQQIPIYADRQLTKELTRVTVDQSIAVLETLFDGVSTRYCWRIAQ